MRLFDSKGILMY